MFIIEGIYIPMDRRREKYDRGLKITYYGMADNFNITYYQQTQLIAAILI